MDNCSIGLNAVLYTLSQLPRAKKSKPFDCLLVNVSTIVRNCYDQRSPTNEVISKVYNDIDVLIKHFANYSKIIRVGKNPSVVFYIPNYSHISPSMRKTSNNATNQNVEKILMLIAKEQKTHSERHQMQGLTVHSVKVGTNKLPHQELYAYLKNAVPGMQPESMHYGLLTHVYLDFHLAARLSLITLESYTGAQRSPNTFGAKVFGAAYIPFNRFTHAIFGDKLLLKSQVTGKLRTELFKRAQNNYWITKTVDDMLKDLKLSNLLPTDKLLSVDI